MNRRIWELDFCRGLCIFLMIYCHIVYDLTELFSLLALRDTSFYDWAMAYTGIFFLILSGISVTLGRHPVKRGLTVLLGGVACWAATYLMFRAGFATRDIVIYFGILHCIGCCMLLWPVFRRLPFWLLAVLGVGLILLQPAVESARADSWLLLPLGIRPYGFASSDYFPLIPSLGWFLAGSSIGKLLYRKKVSLLPQPRFFLFRFLSFCGRHSLLIYLIHQPVLAGGIYLLSLLS